MAKIFEFVRLPFQSKEALDGAVLLGWENAHGLQLPSDYRRFMLRTNGGAVRPYVFDLAVPDASVSELSHPLSEFNDWPTVVQSGQEDLAVPLRNIPPGRVAIGSTETGLDITLSLTVETFGQIEAWVRDIFNVWGEGGNTTIVPLAESFSAFLDLLHAGTASDHHYLWAGIDQRGQPVHRIELP